MSSFIVDSTVQCDFAISDSKPTELLFELMDWDSKTVNALYNRFQIGNETERYQIKTLGLYDGNAGDSFDSHDGSKFSTADNDHSSTGTCASSFGKLYLILIWFIKRFLQRVAGGTRVVFR